MLETEYHIGMGVEKRKSKKKKKTEIRCTKAAELLKKIPKEVYCTETSVPTTPQATPVP